MGKIEHGLLVASLLWLCACGGAQTTASSGEQAGGQQSSDSSGGESGMQASAEVGGLNKEKVEQGYQSAMTDVKQCIAEGRKRIPYLGGDMAVFLSIDPQGKALSAYFERSDLGDHQVESCILGALKAQSWPKPVGGKVGETRKSFGFAPGMAGDDLKMWSADQLAQAMAAEEDGAAAYKELTKQLGACRTEVSASKLTVTLYIDEDGMAQAVGVSGDDKSAGAVSCVETVAKTTSFPAPGSAPAKVTVESP